MKLCEVATVGSGTAGDETVSGKKLAPKGERREEWPQGLDLSKRRTITTLKGCPRVVHGEFEASYTLIKDFEGAPEEIDGTAWFVRCKNLTSLKDIHKHIKRCKALSFSGTPIRRNFLGVLLIKDLEVFSNTLGGKAEIAVKIINKYLKQPYGNKRLMDAQSEMLDAGLDDFAKL